MVDRRTLDDNALRAGEAALVGQHHLDPVMEAAGDMACH